MKKKRARNLIKPNELACDASLEARQGLVPDLRAAKEYAFLLLKFRLRSEKELLWRLKQKGFSEALCLDTLNFLKDRQFVDDRVFAKSWVEARLKRPYGLRRIKQELIEKGLDKEVIEVALAQGKENYQESAIIKQLAQQRFFRLKNVDLLKAKARVYAYLIRRGFSPDISSDIVKGL